MWRLADEKYGKDGKKLLVSEKILESDICYYFVKKLGDDNYENRIIDGIEFFATIIDIVS